MRQSVVVHRVWWQVLAAFRSGRLPLVVAVAEQDPATERMRSWGLNQSDQGRGGTRDNIVACYNSSLAAQNAPMTPAVDRAWWVPSAPKVHEQLCCRGQGFPLRATSTGMSSV